MFRKGMLVFFVVVGCLRSIQASSCERSSEEKEAKSSWFLQPDADRSDIGYRFFLHDYRQAKSYGVEQCALFCLRDSRCKSYNYLHNEEICELNEVDRSMVEETDWLQHEGKWLPTIEKLIRYPGSEYHSRSSLDLTEEGRKNTVLGPCSTYVCPEGYLCSPLIGDVSKPSCVKVSYTLKDFQEEWSAWSSWGGCSTTCGGGVQERTRECGTTDTKPWLCVGHPLERRLCMTQNCPMWSYWGPWSDCGPEKCGSGMKSRSRTCMWGVLPDHGSCAGSHTEDESCRLISCSAAFILSNGTFGYVMAYDDKEKFDPIWRRVCRPNLEEAYIGAQVGVCKHFKLGASPYNGVRTNISENYHENSIVLGHCSGQELNPLECFHQYKSNCTENFYVNCTKMESCKDHPFNVSGNYYLYPQKSNLSPFIVYCNFTDEHAVTVMYHNTTEEVPLTGSCEKARCYRYNVAYFNPLPQIVFVINSSVNCRQFVKVRCRSMDLIHGAWLARDGTLMQSWGSTNPNSCPCGDRGDCYISTLRCNCYANRATTLEDQGYITEKERLPFIAGLFGDLGAYSEQGWLTLGPLECHA